MNQLNNEYITSLIYRHRNKDGISLYLDHFGLNHNHEPFPIFGQKALSVHQAIDRFLLHGVDYIEQQKNLILFLSTNQWYSKITFSYINSQLRFLVPQNLQIIHIDLGGSRPTVSWLLRTIMRASGIEHVEKEDSDNLKKWKKYIEFQWSEYKKKFYIILFRSDNLSFAQLKILRLLSVHDANQSPHAYFVLEGSLYTTQALAALRKDSIQDIVYDTFYILHRGSLQTVSENIAEKLDGPIDRIMNQTYFRRLFFLADGMHLYSLIHTILQRMTERSIQVLNNENDFQSILSDIKNENNDFIERAQEYKKKLEKKDYIFPPELLRDGPSITEARRFFKWMGWEE